MIKTVTLYYINEEYIQMLKKCIYMLIFLIIPFLIPKEYGHASASTADNMEVKGVWISYGDFEYAGLYNQSENNFRINSEKMFSKLDKRGFNTVYFHVRPFDDAIYPNSSFDWCTYISKKPLKYDALSILIETAHKHNIKFHAWINPYRITMDKIYNPAKKSTTKHIVKGVKEIIERYDVDGIHFDDYFYPSKSKGNKYYKVSKKKRMKNVNNMVKTVYSEIKSYNPDIQFGISPAGNVKYAKSIGCDVDTWLTCDGYVDYIIPQIYWSDNYILNGRKKAMYSDTLDEWAGIGLGNVPVYTGLALYKAGTKSSIDRGWRRSDNIKKQIKLADIYGCQGYVMFSYKSIFTSAGKKELKNV